MTLQSYPQLTVLQTPYQPPYPLSYPLPLNLSIPFIPPYPLILYPLLPTTLFTPLPPTNHPAHFYHPTTLLKHPLPPYPLATHPPTPFDIPRAPLPQYRLTRYRPVGYQPLYWPAYSPAPIPSYPPPYPLRTTLYPPTNRLPYRHIPLPPSHYRSATLRLSSFTTRPFIPLRPLYPLCLLPYQPPTTLSTTLPVHPGKIGHFYIFLY